LENVVRGGGTVGYLDQPGTVLTENFDDTLRRIPTLMVPNPRCHFALPVDQTGTTP